MLQVDKYSHTSPLRSIHPMEKAAFCLSYLLFSLITKSLSIALVTFMVMSAVLLLQAKIPWQFYIKLLMLPFFFLLTSVITLVLSIAPIEVALTGSLWDIRVALWQIYVTGESVLKGLQLIATVLACISCMYLLILTTPLPDLLWMMQKARVPSLFIELVAFTYRFIFVLLEKSQEIYIAQASRLGYRSYRDWLASLAQLIVGLFIKALQSARELQIAMDSRGGEEMYPIDIAQPYKRKHWIVIGCSVFLLALLSTL
ncbi:cobalt ECF transporter T component CbiQ [Ammoniphilus sp. 3BR4]|uniref:cobalt ECF transporter T component CbiQ n=1 Tax=Ammoniphilus sp. 3BR4 TaxID=3158265 RepID=UPI00346689B9